MTKREISNMKNKASPIIRSRKTGKRVSQKAFLKQILGTEKGFVHLKFIGLNNLIAYQVDDPYHWIIEQSEPNFSLKKSETRYKPLKSPTKIAKLVDGCTLSLEVTRNIEIP